MSARSAFGLLGLGFVAGVLVAGVVALSIDRSRQDAHDRLVDSLQILQDQVDQAQYESERIQAGLRADLEASRDSLAQLDAYLRALSSRIKKVQRPVLPDAGCVPAPLVKVALDEMTEQLALRDSVIGVQQLAIEEWKGRDAKWDALYTARTTDFVAERVQRQKWEHAAKTAPRTTKLAFLAEGEVGIPTVVGDTVNALARVGLSVAIKGFRGETGYEHSRLDGDRVFVRVRKEIRLL